MNQHAMPHLPDFETLATHTLEQLLEALEAQDTQQMLELDHDADSLRIELADGRVLIVSIHRASGQLWLASPRSGGLHFSLCAQTPHWQLADGTSLQAALATDLTAMSGHHWTLE